MMRVWYLTDETPDEPNRDPTGSLICLAESRAAVLRFMRDYLLSEEAFAAIQWEIDGDDYHWGYLPGNGEAKYYFLSTAPILPHAQMEDDHAGPDEAS